MKTEKQVSFSKGKTYAKILLSITILSALVVGINSCTEVKSKNTTEKEEPLIPILELQPQTVEVPQTYICDIQAIQFVEVRSKVEGFVNQIFVDEGQHVKKGQKLFQLSY